LSRTVGVGGVEPASNIGREGKKKKQNKRRNFNDAQSIQETVRKKRKRRIKGYWGKTSGR